MPLPCLIPIPRCIVSYRIVSIGLSTRAGSYGMALGCCACKCNKGGVLRWVRSDPCLFINGDVELSLFVVLCCVVFGTDDVDCAGPGSARGEMAMAGAGETQVGLGWVVICSYIPGGSLPCSIPRMYRIVTYHIAARAGIVLSTGVAMGGVLRACFFKPWRTARGPRGERYRCGGVSRTYYLL